MGKIRVVCIVGSGRSGSTVLDTVLGDSSDVESVGELVNAPEAFLNVEECCACGERAVKCDFWLATRKEWTKLSGLKNVAELKVLQLRYERIRKLPYLLISCLLKTKGYREYLHAEQSMYEAIASVSGKKVIIDSSKNPIRAFSLSKIPEIDLFAIHLVRDGRGVAWSYAKSFEKDAKGGVQKKIAAIPAWRTAFSWLLVNILSEILVGWVPGDKFLRIRYEDFVEKPGEILKKIGEFIGVDYRGVSKKNQDGEEVPVGHMIAGNRVRMVGVIRLKPDYGWKESLSDQDRDIFWYIAGWLARRYGYQRTSPK